MIKLELSEAEGRLGRLIEEAAAGQEVIITNAGGSTVRLVPVPREGAGQAPEVSEGPTVVGHALDHFMGTWSAEQEAEVLAAVEVFEQVEDHFWR